jgi:predicted dehydrogenase
VSESPLATFPIGYDELLERCDAVAIATPTGTHAELVMTAARAGRPVFCEKPISSAPPPVEFIAGSGGFFADVTVHDLDVARWLVGEVLEVSAHGAASARRSPRSATSTPRSSS